MPLAVHTKRPGLGSPARATDFVRRPRCGSPPAPQDPLPRAPQQRTYDNDVTRFPARVTSWQTTPRGQTSNRHRYPLEDLRVHRLIPLRQLVQETVKFARQVRAPAGQRFERPVSSGSNSEALMVLMIDLRSMLCSLLT